MSVVKGASKSTFEGDIEDEVVNRVNNGWIKWRSLSVLCDRRMPIKLKGKVYKTAVRPAMLYGAECWAAKKQHKQKLHNKEMKMLRWAGGVTLLDKIQNQRVRGSFGVAPIVEKMTESRLRLYGHIMRRPAEHMVRKTLEIEELPRRPGRPKTTWMARVRRDMKAENLNENTT